MKTMMLNPCTSKCNGMYHGWLDCVKKVCVAWNLDAIVSDFEATMSMYKHVVQMIG